MYYYWVPLPVGRTIPDPALEKMNRDLNLMDSDHIHSEIKHGQLDYSFTFNLSCYERIKYCAKILN